HDPGPRAAGTLSVEVRSGERGNRLVRAVRVGNDHADARRQIAAAPLTPLMASAPGTGIPAGTAPSAGASTNRQAWLSSRIFAANSVWSAWPARCATRWP